MAGVWIALGLLLLGAIFFAAAMLTRINWAIDEVVRLRGEVARLGGSPAGSQAASERSRPPDGYRAPMVRRAEIRLVKRRGEDG